MTPARIEAIRKGISAYSREQQVLIRLLRRNRQFTSADFDRLFKNREFRRHVPLRRSGICGDSTLLGIGANGFTEWSWWLGLMQHMIAVGLVDAVTKDGDVVYTLMKGKTMITMTPCSSSQIHAYAYDDATKTLYLQFKKKGPDGTRIGGSIYTYANVTPALFDELCCAASVGTWFGAFLKPRADKYPYVKLTDEQVADLLSGTAPQSPAAGS